MLCSLIKTLAAHGPTVTYIKIRRALAKYLAQRRWLKSASPVSYAVSVPLTGEGPLWVFLEHDLGGGAGLLGQRDVESFVAQGWRVLRWRYLAKVRKFSFEILAAGRTKSFVAKSWAEAARFVEDQKPDGLYCHNLVSWPDPALGLDFLRSLKKSRGIPLEVALHDYFPVCPAFPLLNRQNHFCGLPDDVMACAACLPGASSPSPRAW